MASLSIIQTCILTPVCSFAVCYLGLDLQLKIYFQQVIQYRCDCEEILSMTGCFDQRNGAQRGAKKGHRCDIFINHRLEGFYGTFQLAWEHKTLPLASTLPVPELCVENTEQVAFSTSDHQNGSCATLTMLLFHNGANRCVTEAEEKERGSSPFSISSCAEARKQFTVLSTASCTHPSTIICFHLGIGDLIIWGIIFFFL